jgi:predicted transposase/invertase (TIGR01784 family)
MFINPKTDFAFKKIFGSKNSTDILISFLNAILYQGEGTIASLQILDPYQSPRIKGMKDSYLDIKATLCDGRTVIIEMQVLNTLGFEKRVLYNAAKAYSTQLDIGDDYSLLNPIIALTITDFEMFSNSPKIISSYALREKEDFATYNDDIELVFVELPKFNLALEELETLSDKWIYFLRYANQLSSVPTSMSAEPAIKHAFKVAQQSKLTREEIEIVERSQMVLHDHRNALLYAEQTGEKRGLQKGLQKSRQEEQERQRSLVLRLLSRQIGVVPDGPRTRIQRLTIEQLEELTEELLDFTKVDDLVTWLDRDRT